MGVLIFLAILFIVGLSIFILIIWSIDKLVKINRRKKKAKG